MARCLGLLARVRRSEATLAAGLWATQFALTTQALLVVAWLPWLMRDLGASFAAGAWVVSLYAVILSVGALVGGVVNDYVGPRRVAACGVFIAATGLALHVGVDSYGGFLYVRALTGIGHALLSGAFLALMATRFRRAAGRTFGLVMSGSGVGQTIGVAGGLLLADRGGGFLAFGVCGALLAVAGWRVFLDIGPGGRPENSTECPTVDLRARLGALRGHPAVRQGCVAHFLMYGGSAILIVFFPVWWTASAGGEAATLAAVLFAAGVVQALCTAWGGVIAGRYGVSVIVRRSLWVSGALLLLGSGLHWLPVTWMTAVYLAGVAAMSLRLTPIQLAASRAVPEAHRGTWLGLLFSMGQLGRAGGSAAGALLFAPGGIAVVLIVGAVGFFLAEHAFASAFGKEISKRKSSVCESDVTEKV